MISENFDLRLSLLGQEIRESVLDTRLQLEAAATGARIGLAKTMEDCGMSLQAVQARIGEILKARQNKSSS